MCSHYGGGRKLRVAAVGLSDHTGSQLHEGMAGGSSWVEGSRRSFVATLADILHHRNLPQERHIHLLGQVLHTFLPEEEVTLVGLLGWSEPRHVPHQSENRHIHLG